jgi:hypothetical protein
VVYDEQEGLMRTVVFKANSCCVGFSNFVILALYSALAIAASVATIVMKIEVFSFGEDDKDKKFWWEIFTVFLNAIAVATLTKFLKPVVKYIVRKENHGKDSNFESSLITKYFTVSCVISFTGLMLYAYWQLKLDLVNMLMIFLILFKQLLLNVIEAGKPYRYYPKKFMEHK